MTMQSGVRMQCDTGYHRDFMKTFFLIYQYIYILGVVCKPPERNLGACRCMACILMWCFVEDIIKLAK